MNLFCTMKNNVFSKTIFNAFTLIFFTATFSHAQIERWVYRFNGQANWLDNANSIAYGLDGNIYAAGHSKPTGVVDDFTVISLDTLGNERWVYLRHSADPVSDVAKSVVFGADGNIYAAGRSHTQFMDDLLVISLDSDGNERWVFRSDSTIRNWIEVSSIIYGADDNLYVVGQDVEPAIQSSCDFAVLSLDTLGNERWWYRYNGTGDHWD